MIALATVQVEASAKLVKDKEDALEEAQRVPNKKRFDEFVSHYQLEVASSNAEDKFLQKFKSGHSDILAMLVFLLSSMILTYVYLYLTFTEPFWKLNEAIRELPTGQMVLCRSILGIFMHFIVDKDIRQGLVLMKYALNHPWKFRRWYSAFLIGFIQLALAVTSEYVSIQIVLSTDTYLDAVKDFIALMIVNEFDNHFFEYMHKEDIY